MDTLDDRETKDAFGTAALTAVADPSVSLETTESILGNASYHFAGVGGLTLPSSPLVEQQSEFGFNAWVRFDSLVAGQTIVENEGSFGLELVDDSGDAQIEFFVISAGERKTALSSQILTADTWYHFAAHVKSGRLVLVVGESDEIDLGDTVGSVDITPSPLTIGNTLLGNIDHLELFDFSRAPLAVFSNGQTSIDLVLDGQGEVQTPVLITGVLASPVDGAVPTPPVPVWRSSRAASPRDESFGAFFFTYTDEGISNCSDAIATGENFTGTGIACELSLSLIPVAAIGQALRDVVFQTANFVRGKETHFIIAAFALLTLVANRVPILRSLRAVLLRAQLGFKGLYLEKFLAREAIRVAQEAVETGTARLSPLAEIAGRSLSDPARIALGEIGQAVTPEVARSLESLAVKHGDEGLERIIVALGRALNIPGVNRGILIRVVFFLDRLPFPSLTDDAIEGMAIFLKRVFVDGTGQGATRVPRILADILASAPANQRQQVLNNLFRWIKEGEQAFGGLEQAWQVFLRKGPGTLPGVSTTGNYHVLDYMANVVGFQNVRGLEVRIGTRFLDIQVEKVVKGAVRIVNIELKNLAADSAFRFGNQVAKDIRAIRGVAGFVPGKVGDIKTLIKSLEGLEYVLRGSPTEMAIVVAGLEAAIRRSLGPRLQHLFFHVNITPLGRSLPF